MARSTQGSPQTAGHLPPGRLKRRRGRKLRGKPMLRVYFSAGRASSYSPARTCVNAAAPKWTGVYRGARGPRSVENFRQTPKELGQLVGRGSEIQMCRKSRNDLCLPTRWVRRRARSHLRLWGRARAAADGSRGSSSRSPEDRIKTTPKTGPPRAPRAGSRDCSVR